MTRTTTTGFLADGRVSWTETKTNGLAGSTSNTKKENEYDPASGTLTKVTARNPDGSVAGTAITAYDAWGRKTSYQPSGEAPPKTFYDVSGAVASVTDANGSTKYTDAAGKTDAVRQVMAPQCWAVGSRASPASWSTTRITPWPQARHHPDPHRPQHPARLCEMAAVTSKTRLIIFQELLGRSSDSTRRAVGDQIVGLL
ncbi:hypothetical protein AB0M48_01760 [Lentzea sp. NPDC051208]|uniref:hypothetical protein n=1 Tax=Lentzea sp. NPDC051208 TaxID=3154642 RepID=UPI00343DB425